MNIGKLVSYSEKTVVMWRKRLIKLFSCPELEINRINILSCLGDALRAGAPCIFTAEQCSSIVAMACQKPRNFGRPCEIWTNRELKLQAIKDSIVTSISERQIARIIGEAQIQPTKSAYWLNIKKDPDRIDKILEICHAYREAKKRVTKGEITISIDEMTAIQAKQRTAEDRPPLPGRRLTWQIEHEYIRHGTLCLLGAWDVVEGKAFGWCNPTRNEVDFVDFIKKCQAQYPDAKRLHIVLDNLNTHQSETLVLWVAAQVGTPKEELGVKGKSGILKNMKTRAKYLNTKTHPVVFHYTPKHCSWMNQIEIWFGILMRKVLKSASFLSLDDLENRIMEFIEYFNKTMAKPFKWMFNGFETKESQT